MNLLKKIYVTLRGIAKHPTNRETPIRALLEFCRQQIAVTQISADVCVVFPEHTFLIVPSRMKGSAHFINPGLCEFDDMCFLLHFLRPGDLFVDVGANIGAFTVLASGVCRARTRAFEPHPETFGYLKRNIWINDLQGLVEAVQCAVGRTRGSLFLTNDLGTANFVSDSPKDSTSVDCRCLSDELKGLAPMLLKVDVEGFESDVFAGGLDVLQNSGTQAMIVERTGMGVRYGFDEDALHETIRKAGYHPCTYIPLKRELVSVRDDHQGNIIYVRDKAATLERLKAAPVIHYKSLHI